MKNLAFCYQAQARRLMHVAGRLQIQAKQPLQQQVQKQLLMLKLCLQVIQQVVKHQPQVLLKMRQLIIAHLQKRKSQVQKITDLIN